MKHKTSTYKFCGSNKLADEVAYLATKNDLRVSIRTSSGVFKKEHFFQIFGPAEAMDRFEREMQSAKNRIK
jgi:hypothetical protein